MGKTILLTGFPGCGKTTLIRRVLARLSIPAGGFYTQEVRDSGIRVGFEIVTLDGSRGILAHVDNISTNRVGKYGVDLSALEDIGVRAIQAAIEEESLVVIDEIGPMEIFSLAFRQVVIEALESETTVLGTIVKRSVPFANVVKQKPQVTMVEVTPETRDNLVEQLIQYIRDT